MAKPLVDRVLTDARAIIADRRCRLRCTEAVTALAASLKVYAALSVSKKN